MSAAVKKKPTFPPRNGAVAHEQNGPPALKPVMRPGTPVIYWTTVGAKLKPCPAHLDYYEVTTGRWCLVYWQRHNPGYAPSKEHSETPEANKWTFPEAYDEWLASQQSLTVPIVRVPVSPYLMPPKPSQG